MTPPLPSNAVASWKNPPAAIQIKYNLTSLSQDFEPTPQEQELLDMYETIKLYEKEAARLKEEAARAKLEAAAAKYEEANQPVANSKKRRNRPVEDRLMGGMDILQDDADDDRSDLEVQQDDDDDDDDDKGTEQVSMAERRAAKLAEWQEEVDESMKEERKQEEMRGKLLGNIRHDDELDDVLIRRRKRPAIEAEENKTSLISNIITQQTPPHEFSKALDIKSGEGVVLFPNKGYDGHTWNPPSSALNANDEALTFTLDGFDMAKAKTGQSSNTIVIKFMVPSESKRFSINIAGPNHRDFETVLFHFNPRQFEKGGQLVLNNKQEGQWGQSVNVPLSRIPKIFGETSSTLIIQIHSEGFDVFIEGKHCARFEHREELNNDAKLYIQFPSTDDRGKLENWSVYKAWWGRKKLMAKEDVADVYGVNTFVGMHPKKLFIRGLSTIHTEAEVELRRAQLERSFHKYGGDRGVSVIIPTNVTFAFVECESEQAANRALEEMSGEYDIKRARRTRSEALQEERAASEGKAGPESTEWD